VSIRQNNFPFGFSNLTRYKSVFLKINNFLIINHKSQIGASRGNLIKSQYLSMLPSLRKLLVRFRLLSADGYQSFRSRFRLSCITELNSLFARSDHPATHTTQSRPSCITELNSLFASPFTVCCTSLAQRPSSLRELEVALSLHYRNQYHSSKFSPRI
jgi:hypothetical protein